MHLRKPPRGSEAIVFRTGQKDVEWFVGRTEGLEESVEISFLHGGATGGDGVDPAANMKKDSAARSWLGMRRGVVLNKKF
jgi:hypothetical protein